MGHELFLGRVKVRQVKADAIAPITFDEVSFDEAFLGGTNTAREYRVITRTQDPT